MPEETVSIAELLSIARTAAQINKLAGETAPPVFEMASLAQDIAVAALKLAWTLLNQTILAGKEKPS